MADGGLADGGWHQIPTMNQDRSQPALHHPAVAIAFDVAFDAPHRGKHALNRIG